jgi:uncharacterized protein
LEDGKAALNLKDYQTTLNLLKPLAEQENAEAQFLVGNLYLDGHGVKIDNIEGANWIKRAADQNYVPAQVKLGHLYEVCKGDDRWAGCVVLPQHDNIKAMKWFRKAADQGSAEAEYRIGSMYWLGSTAIPKNEKEALLWSQKSAEHGYSSAQLSLGRYYKSTNNYTEALKWLFLAADQNNSWAREELASMYARGEGVQKDLVQAYMWANIHPDASFGSVPGQSLYDKMTPQQRKEGDRLIAEWREKHSIPPPASVDYKALRSSGGQ